MNFFAGLLLFPLPLFTLILFPDFINHFLIPLYNESSHIPAFLAVVDFAGIPADLVVEIRIPADRADLNQFFPVQNRFLL